MKSIHLLNIFLTYLKLLKYSVILCLLFGICDNYTTLCSLCKAQWRTYNCTTDSQAYCLWGWDGYWKVGKIHRMSSSSDKIPALMISSRRCNSMFWQDELYELINSVWNEELFQKWEESNTALVYKKGDKTNIVIKKHTTTINYRHNFVHRFSLKVNSTCNINY